MNWNDIMAIQTKMSRSTDTLDTEIKSLFDQEIKSITKKIDGLTNAQRVEVNIDLLKETAVFVKRWRVAVREGEIYWTADKKPRKPIRDYALARSMLELIVECETRGIKADFSGDYPL